MMLNVLSKRGLLDMLYMSIIENNSRLLAERIINEGFAFDIEDDNEEEKNVLYLSTSDDAK